MKCRSCSTEIPDTAYDCPSCGAPVEGLSEAPTATALPRGQAVLEGTAVKTLVLSDLVNSTRLVEDLGDRAATEVLRRHDRTARDLLREHGGREIDKSDGFLLLFERPIHAVLFARSYHRALVTLARQGEVELRARVGIHLGEVVLRSNPPEDVARGAKPLEAEGLAKPVVARLASLAAGGQTLLTRAAFDMARRSAVDGLAEAGKLRWLAHGRYVFQGVEEPVEVFEIGEEGTAPLKAPEGSEKAARVLGEDVILGWRPAPGLSLPRRAHWAMEKKLGEGGFGEVWLAVHRKTRERRVFKFCYEASRLRSLQREITLFRLLKEELGNRRDITRILDWNFEQAPYYIESEYTLGGNLAEWAEGRGGIAAVALAERLEILAQTAEALAAAHSVGVLHKDVKPSNILIYRDADGRSRARLTDFGVGAVLEPKRLQEVGITALGMTETAEASSPLYGGTRLYMAPEVLEGKPATLQADIYALGVVLYQVVVGDFSHALASGWRRDVEDELLREDIAAAVDGSPERRLASVRELAQRLRSLEARRAEREAERQRQAGFERSRRRRQVMTWAAAVFAVFAVGMGILALQVLRQAERAERTAAKMKNLARVAVAEAWIDKDPTKAALVLLEVEEPEEVALAVPTMREALSYPLAAWEGRGHTQEVHDVSWSPDGRRIVSASGDGTARIWNADGRGRPIVLHGHRGGVLTARFSPTGEHIVTASTDHTSRVWNTNGSGQPVVLEGHENTVLLASWSPSGDRILTASSDGTARIWNADGSGRPVVLRGHKPPMIDAKWSPTGDRVLTVSGTVGGGQACVWDLESPQEPSFVSEELPHEGHRHGVRNAAWSPEGGRIAVVYQELVQIWVLGRPGPSAVLETLAFGAWWSPEGDQILVVADDGTARLWSPDDDGPAIVVPLGPPESPEFASTRFDGNRILMALKGSIVKIWSLHEGMEWKSTVLVGHQNQISATSLSPDGFRVATASGDRTLRVWDVAGPRVPSRAEPVILDGLVACFSSDGPRLGATSSNGGARVWRTDGSGIPSTAKPVVLEGPKDNMSFMIPRLDIRPDGERIVATRDSSARVWNTDGTGEPTVLQGHDDWITAVSFDPAGRRILTASRDASVRIWKADGGGEPIVLQGHDDVIWDASWSPDGNLIASASRDGTARIWNVDRGSELMTLEGHDDDVNVVSWSPDGSRLVTASDDGTARVWNVEPGERTPEGPTVLRGHQAPILAASWNPSGDRIATASRDGTARIWNADGSGDPLVLEGHDNEVVSVSWSGDGRRVVTASEDRTARIWDVAGPPGEPIVLEGHERGLLSAVFSPNGEHVLTTSFDFTVRLWRVHTEDLLALIRSATTLCLDPPFREKNLGEEPEDAWNRYAECERSHGREPR